MMLLSTQMVIAKCMQSSEMKDIATPTNKSQQTVVALFAVYLRDHEEFLQLDCSPASIVLNPVHPICSIHAFEDRNFGNNQTQTAKPPSVCVGDIMYYLCVSISLGFPAEPWHSVWSWWCQQTVQRFTSRCVLKLAMS